MSGDGSGAAAPLVVELAAHCYSGISGYTHSSILQEMGVRSRIQWRERVPGRDALLSRVRNHLLSDAVQAKDVDVQIWLDHDIQFQPCALTGLALHCAETRGIVGGLYPFRSKGSLGFPIRLGPGQHLRYQVAVPESITAPVRMDEGDLIQVECAGGGFVAFWMPAIRDAIPELTKDAEIVLDPWEPCAMCGRESAVAFATDGRRLLCSRCDSAMRVTEYVRGRQGGTAWDFCRPFTLRHPAPRLAEYISEDWAACLRFGAMGVPCHVWTGPYLVHYGEIGFTPEDAAGRGVNVPEALRAWEQGRAVEGKQP